MRMYNNLEIKCSNYENCKKKVTISELQKHEEICNKPKCLNFKICDNPISNNLA